MEQKLSLILFVSLLYPSWSCKLLMMTENQDVGICESWDEFIKTGSHPQWKKLILKNTANQEKVLLKNGAFINMPHLESLLIEGFVNKIEPDVFKDLPNLKHLFLNENEIEELPEGIFNGLSINRLYIKHSHLRNIYPGTFDQVDLLDLVGNQINPGLVFRNTNITMLDLSNNSISTLEDCAFCGMNNLQYLTLHENFLTTFDPVKILGETSLIRGLGLNGNKLTKIAKFGAFPNLHGLSVANNSIEKIEDNCFVDCPNIGFLEFGNNKLKDIPPNILPKFADKGSSYFILIHGNKIQCLSKELRNKIKNLEKVTVNDNPWKCECLNDVIDWAKDRKAWVGCYRPENVCNVSCVDKNNIQQVITLYHDEEEPEFF